VNGTLYFASNDRVSSTEIWSSDGTEAGTVLVKRFTSGAPSSSISQIIQANGKLYVVATTEQYGSEIWVADLELPTPAGDYNQNSVVDAADYVLWRKTLGGTTNLQANGDNTGASASIIDEADYVVWGSNFGNTAWATSSSGKFTTSPDTDLVAAVASSAALSAPSAPAVDTALAENIPTDPPLNFGHFRGSTMGSPSAKRLSTPLPHTSNGAMSSSSVLLAIVNQRLFTHAAPPINTSVHLLSYDAIDPVAVDEAFAEDGVATHFTAVMNRGSVRIAARRR
jgi:ELWxxDGT repeat protein